MSWNYRVVHHIDNGEDWYAIHEAYYNKDEGIYAISTMPNDPHGDTPEELKADINLMLKAFEQPVLEYDMEFAKPDDDEDLPI